MSDTTISPPTTGPDENELRSRHDQFMAGMAQAAQQVWHDAMKSEEVLSLPPEQQNATAWRAVVEVTLFNYQRAMGPILPVPFRHYGAGVVFPGSVTPDIQPVFTQDVERLGETMIVEKETQSASFIFRFQPKTSLLLPAAAAPNDAYLVQFPDIMALAIEFRARELYARHQQAEAGANAGTNQPE